MIFSQREVTKAKTRKRKYEDKNESEKTSRSHCRGLGCEHFTGVERGQTAARNNPDNPGRVASHEVQGQL